MLNQTEKRQILIVEIWWSQDHFSKNLFFIRGVSKRLFH
jgi:hypothetical protein